MRIIEIINDFIGNFQERFSKIIFNNKFVLSLFFLVALLVTLIVVDTYLLPKTTINDTVVTIEEVLERSTETDAYKRVGYKCKTKKGHLFYTREIDFLSSKTNAVELKHTLLLKNVIALRAYNKTFSDTLFSNTVGELKYFYLFFLTTLLINMYIIYFDVNIKRNALWNLIGFNVLLLVLWLVIEHNLKLQTPLFSLE